MDTTISTHTTPDTLKRKRDTLAEDNTPGLEGDGTDKRRGTEKSDDIYPTNIPTIKATDEPTHTAGTTMSPHATTTTSDSARIAAMIDCLPSDIISDSDDETNIPNHTTAKPTLQTIPRELRDSIYELVAATEERIVLGRRMVEACRADTTLTLDQCFDQAVALHPLSMTCRQFRDEFQDVHFSVPEPYWVLLVNNFDLDQLQIFSDFIQSGEFIKVIGKTDYEGQWEHALPVYNVLVILRLQMDHLVQYSASKLYDNVYYTRQGAAPRCLADSKLRKRWLGVADIVARYVPRTTASVTNVQSMTHTQAGHVKHAFGKLGLEVESMPDFKVRDTSGPFDNETTAAPRSFDYLRWCWFVEFSHCAKTMSQAGASQAERLSEFNEVLEDARCALLYTSKNDDL